MEHSAYMYLQCIFSIFIPLFIGNNSNSINMSSYSTTVASASLQPQPQSQIYSQVSKRGNETSAPGTSKNTEFEATKHNMEGSGSSSNLRGCDTDSAALERLSQLLTSSKDSEVSVKNDLINLDDHQQLTYAPMAAAEDSLGKRI